MLVHAAGGICKVEPHNDDRPHGHKRADIQILLSAFGALPPVHWQVDVQVLNLLSRSHIASYMKPEAILDRAAELKRRKHEPSAEAAGAKFIPFIMSMQAQLGSSAESLLKQLFDRAVVPLGIDYKLLMSLTMQRAVARSLQWASQRCFAARNRA
jgi:hypothetical protein